MNLNQKLSDHFSLWECIRSETASRLGIDNTPSNKYVPKLIKICNEILEPPRVYFNISFRPNSVYRCLELNRALGSKDTSSHPKAEAVDLEIPGVSNYDLAVWLRNHIPVFDQLILECYIIGQPSSGWVHMSIRENNNRMQVLTYSKGKFITGLAK